MLLIEKYNISTYHSKATNGLRIMSNISLILIVVNNIILKSRNNKQGIYILIRTAIAMDNINSISINSLIIFSMQIVNLIIIYIVAQYKCIIYRYDRNHYLSTVFQI
jgi:hypothetical protein